MNGTGLNIFTTLLWNYFNPFSLETESFLRPFALRLANTLRPLADSIRLRKP
jgi:hypothetical protein